MRSIPIVAALLALSLHPGSSSAQSLSDLTVGARVRVFGERPTNVRIEQFRIEGTIVRSDTAHIVVRHDEDAKIDTVYLFAVRRLSVFKGLRSRKDMIVTGGVVGTLLSFSAYTFARQVTSDPSTLTMLRRAIPIFALGGITGGIVVSREDWVSVELPMSVFKIPRMP